MRLLAILVLVSGLAGLTWIARRNETAPTKQTEDLPTEAFDLASLQRGDSPITRILQGWVVRHYDQKRENTSDVSRLEWSVQGDAVAMDDKENAFVERPCIVFNEYAQGGREPASMVTFEGSGGTYTRGMKTVFLRGGVQARASDGAELITEDLLSSLDRKQIETEGPVHLRRPGMDLRGTGFKSDSQLAHMVFQHAVKAEMRAGGGTTLMRTRGSAQRASARTSLGRTIVTCDGGMTFDRTEAKKGEKGPVHTHATFAGGVRLVRDQPGRADMRLSCDSLEAFLLDEKPERRRARTTVEKLIAQGHVRVEDADGTMECDVFLAERKSDALEVLTLSGPLQRVVVRRSGGLGLASSPPQGTSAGPAEAGCSGPIVIEREGKGRTARTRVHLRRSVSLAQPGSLVQADEMDLVLRPPEKGGQAEASSIEARGNVFLASEARVALSDRLSWDRERQVTKLDGLRPVDVVEADRRIRARELTLTQSQKGEKVLATGDVTIETQDLTARGQRLEADPGTDRMVVVGPPDVEVKQGDSTIRCRQFTLRHDERRMMAEGGVRIHFIDDPAKPQGNAKKLAPVLPGQAPKPGEKREGDIRCDYEEFSWKEDGAMERMVSTGNVSLDSAGTHAEGRTFDWDATKGEGVIEAEPWAEAVSTPQKEGADPARFHARRIRFTSAGRLILSGPKQVEMVREVEDDQGKKTKELMTVVCERDMVIEEGGKVIRLEKEVVVSSAQVSIRCDSMRVFVNSETNELERLLAWGNIRYRSDEGLALAQQMEWEPKTQATDLRSLPPAAVVRPDGSRVVAEHIVITNQGKDMVAENEYQRRNIWLPGGNKK